MDPHWTKEKIAGPCKQSLSDSSFSYLLLCLIFLFSFYLYSVGIFTCLSFRKQKNRNIEIELICSGNVYICERSHIIKNRLALRIMIVSASLYIYNLYLIRVRAPACAGYNALTNLNVSPFKRLAVRKDYKTYNN